MIQRKHAVAARRGLVPVFLAVLAWLLLPAAATVDAAADTVEEWARIRAGLKYRLDLDYLYDHLTPNDAYGDWHTATATLYVKTLPRVTPFVSTGLADREDARGSLTVGAYVDWAPGRLYSYSAYTTGGRSDHLPRARYDHDFFLNTGPFSLVLGGGWLEDHFGHEDWYLTAGPRVWRGRVIAEYRLTRQESDPGARVGWNHLLSLGLGAEGESWLFATLAVGEESYRALQVAPPQDVHHDFWEAAVAWQRWFGPRWGLKAQLRWLDLGTEDDGYEKLGVGGGIFWEF